MATVMVVDDEERVRTLLAKSLSSQGHSVVTAATANAAIDRLASRDVDLVVLDLVMPGVNGLAVLNAIRERSRRRR
jgi:CheY-like chemotaxis protein